MRLIQKIGLGLFVLSMLTFIVSISLSQFTLTNELIEAQIADEDKRAAFQQSTQAMLGKSYASQFSFVADLKSGIKEANSLVSEQFKITDAEVEQLLAKSEGNTYDLAKADDVFPKGEKRNDFKNKALNDYTSWMQGRSYESPEALKNDLQNAVNNINAAIVKDKGFPDYEFKTFLFNVTKKASSGLVVNYQGWLILLIFVLGSLGALLYIYPEKALTFPGIKNNFIFQSGVTNRGAIGISVGVFLIAFYVLLYFQPYYMTNWVILVDPISQALNGGEASQWFLYGFLYTLSIFVMGVRMIIKYRHSKYQIWRTASVMFFQTSFAFIIPQILLALNQPYMDLKNIWPLNYDLFTPGRMQGFISAGGIGMTMLFWGIISTLVGVPLMTYFFGKRWYCSWVCGCGGLAETLGDPYRQLSDKSLGAWKVERWLIHGVLVFAVVMTLLMLYTFFTNSSYILGLNSYTVKEYYGFLISSIFAGVVGTGFYPFMGNRVWCRFGCPLAAYLGLVQRFQSRFRITTNGGQCISCGNCSTYCEMGIDVRWYAQRGQNIVRSSCVGCGICSAVCPRGVLNLENGPQEGRLNDTPILIGTNGVEVVA